MVVMKRRLQAFFLSMEWEEIIILFPSRIVLTPADEKCIVQPGLDVSCQKAPKVPSHWGPISLSSNGTFPRLLCSVATGPPLCLPKVDSQSGNTPAVVCAVSCTSLFLARHLSPDSQESIMHMCTQQAQFVFASRPETNKHAAYLFFFHALTFFCQQIYYFPTIVMSERLFFLTWLDH